MYLSLNLYLNVDSMDVNDVHGSIVFCEAAVYEVLCWNVGERRLLESCHTLLPLTDDARHLIIDITEPRVVHFYVGMP